MDSSTTSAATHCRFHCQFWQRSSSGPSIAVPIGLVTLRRLSCDYQAVALLVISIIATSVASNEPHLFNGAAGISLVPHPLADWLGVDLLTYQWIYVGFLCGLVFAGVLRNSSRHAFAVGSLLACDT